MYKLSFSTSKKAITSDWLTSIPLIPATILILFGQKMAIPAM